MQKKLKTHIAIILFVCLALGLPVGVRYYLGQQEKNALEAQKAEYKGTLYKIEKIFEREDDRVLLPLKKTVSEEALSVALDYPEHLVEINVPEIKGSAFEKAGAGGNLEHVDSIWAKDTKDGCKLQVIFDAPMACDVSVDDGYIAITAVRPAQKYDRIVVVDPGRYEENDLCLDVAERVQAELAKSDITVILARNGERVYTERERAAFASDVGTDMLIGLEMPRSEDASLCGVRSLYNSVFFMPGLGSGDLAYLLEENVLEATGAKSLGIEAGDGNELIDSAQMPVTLLQLGYQSNEEEQKRLNSETYRQSLADGICQGIIKAYEQKE